MIRKKLLLVALLSVVFSRTFAQHEEGHFSIIPRLGVSVANMSNNDVYYSSGDSDDSKKLKSRNKAGLNVGADIEYQATSFLSLSAGLYYSMHGSRYPDHQIQGASDKSYTGISDCHIDLQYINVPVMVNYYVSQGFAIKAGVQAGFLLDSKQQWEETDFIIKEDNTKEYGKSQTYEQEMSCRTFDFSIPLGVSYEYMNVILDARYNLGLTNIYKNSGVSSKNRVFTFTVGYRFGL